MRLLDFPERQDRLRRFRLGASLASSALLLMALPACHDAPTPSHVVVVGQHETIDDIGRAECGDSIMDLGILPRRNLIRTFNKLPNNIVHAGQRLNIPDSFCAQTGDRIPVRKK